MTPDRAEIFGGVDTHKQVHVAAALDAAGRLLATAEFDAAPHGYRELAGWLRSWGAVWRVGVEGTGSYGASLTRHLAAAGVEVVEVNRPNRQTRRRRGKTDTVDGRGRGASRAQRRGCRCAQVRRRLRWRRSAPSAWLAAPPSRPAPLPATRSTLSR